MNVGKMSSAITVWVIGMVGGSFVVAFGLGTGNAAGVPIGLGIHGVATIYLVAVGLMTLARCADSLNAISLTQASEATARRNAAKSPQRAERPVRTAEADVDINQM